jgi:hypothetical protein
MPAGWAAQIDTTNPFGTNDIINFNIPWSDSGHVYYQSSLGNVQPVPAGTSSDADVTGTAAPQWQHSWWKITLQSTLPSINVPVFINGYSQSGASWNTLANDDNAVLRIELNGGGPGASGNGDGLTLAGGNSAVRGLVINGLGYHYGIVLTGGGSDLVQGNFVGTDVSGLIAPYGLPNFSTFGVSSSDLHEGVHVIESLGFQHDYIGTDSRADPIDPAGWTEIAERNIISAAAAGVVFWGPGNTDPSQYGVAQTNNVVAGNFIGTDSHGTTALGNWIGIAPLGGAHDDLVGTDGNGVNDAGERNVISGNQVGVAGGGGTALASYRDAVAGNYIGVGADGSPLGNLGSGVVVDLGSLSDRIGGPSASLGNTIAYNGINSASLHYDIASHGVPLAKAPGVWIFNFRSSPEQTTVQGNSIHDNAGLGIDLGGAYPSPGPDGVTLNDSQGHTGPNNFQDFPIVTSTVVSGLNVTVSGTLNTSAGTAPFTVDVYASPTADPTYYGQGQYYLGATTIPSGSSSFSAAFSTANLPAALLAAPWYISTTATDKPGNTSEFSKDVCIPVAGVTGPSDGVPGQPRTFTLSANASAVDQPAGFTFAINWGDGISQAPDIQTIPRTAGNGAGVAVDHVYTTPGTYTVSVTATDLDGGTSSAVSQAISVQQVVMEGNSLAVGGTLGNDTITLTPADATGDITVNLNGTTSFIVNGVRMSTFKPTDHILVYGQSGNDQITLQASNKYGPITVPAFIYGGGTGKEMFSVAGSTANNVVIGGGGTNQITGGLGRDLLIAGLGASKLFAGSGGDILIGGWTDYDLTSTAMTYDKKLAALEAIMAEWGSTDSYMTRVNDLTNGGGLNGSYLLNASTVHDNGQTDTLFGFPAAAPIDWFFASAANIPLFKHQNPGEAITTIS